VNALRAKIKVCMFDQYGTVVDMQGGLTAIATPFLKNKGWSGNPSSFVTWWRRTHFENSMIDALLQRGLDQNRTAMQAIGYRQVVEHILGKRSLPETVALVKQKTRQFAKRQMTWFRHQLHVQWLELAAETSEGDLSRKIDAMAANSLPLD
jgi:2-haloacid dehalogenase